MQNRSTDTAYVIIWDAVEDVIKCVRSAIKTGIVPGCQLTIMSCCNDAVQEISKKYQHDGTSPSLFIVN